MTTVPKALIALRVEPEVLARLDALAPKLAHAALQPSRSDAHRVALLRGIEVLEKQFEQKGSDAAAKPAATRPAATKTRRRRS